MSGHPALKRNQKTKKKKREWTEFTGLYNPGY